MILLSGGRESALLLYFQVEFHLPCFVHSFPYIVTASVILRASSFDRRSSVQLSLKSENRDGT